MHKCRQVKPYSDFDPNGHLKDGTKRLHSWCKACLRQHNKHWRKDNKQYFKDWASKNPDKVRATEIKYRIGNPIKYKAKRDRYNHSHREIINNYSKRYRINHIENIRKYMMDYFPNYYLNHKEELIKYQQHYRNTPMGRIVQRTVKLKRRAAKMGSTIGDGVDDFIKQIKQAPIVTCHICKATLVGNKCHIDHIFPLSKKGPHTKDNIAPACPICNIKKGSKILFQNQSANL